MPPGQAPPSRGLHRDLLLGSLQLGGLRKRDRQHAILERGLHIVGIHLVTQHDLPLEGARPAFAVEGRFFLEPLLALERVVKGFNAIDKRIKGSDAPFSMAVYRYEGDGKQYRVVRLASVPIVINGRRWGDYEISYAL